MNEMKTPAQAGISEPRAIVPRAAVLDDTSDTSYVDWQAILVGTVTALSVAFVLLTFGSAVGLSAVSPWTSSRTSVAAVSIGAGFWMVLVHLWAFALGGYLTGRMAHHRTGADKPETEFRDGAHGVAVWGLAVTFAATIAAFAAAASVRATDTSASHGNDPVTVATDTLLRSARTGGPGNDELRGEVGRLLTRSLGAGSLAATDRAYLTEVVAARSGIAAPDADRRVNEAVVQLKDSTNRLRKVGIVVGFMTAAALLLAGAAAWWGASIGGQHRDASTVWPGFARHGQPRTSSKI